MSRTFLRWDKSAICLRICSGGKYFTLFLAARQTIVLAFARRKFGARDEEESLTFDIIVINLRPKEQSCRFVA